MTETRRGVLITRSQTAAEATARLVAARGFTPIIAPLLAIQALQPELPDDPQAILVTSANALPALHPGPTKLLAVGDSTAERARIQGFTNVTSASGDAAALAELAASTLDRAGKYVLLASGQGQGAVLAADLRARGFTVVQRDCYAARPVAKLPETATQALQTNSLHAATFLSLETAQAFMRLLPTKHYPALASVFAVAIGRAAADALHTLPWREVRQASTPTLDNVLALL